MQPVRRRIAEIIKENGTATVAELAEALGMAQVSVRHHLDILVGEDLVQFAGVRRHAGAGRPSQVYALTEKAHSLFPQRHDRLASGILAELKAVLPAAEVRGIFARLAERVAGEAPTGTPDQTLEERLDQVAAFLTEKGYDARWQYADGHYELQACNCPYIGVADEHAEICLMDQTLIQSLLPGAIRLESRAMDDVAYCRYRIAHKAHRKGTPSGSEGDG